MSTSRGNFRHGHSSGRKLTSIYASWNSMIGRCTNPNNNRFYCYGGRGITVCERWWVFENFLADMGEKPAGMSLDRKDTNGNYEPSNCKWSTTREQMRNQTSTKLTFEKAVTIVLRSLAGMTGKRAAEPFGVSQSMTYEIMSGRSWPDALIEGHNRFALLP